jgi:hypothetical protein
MGASDCRRWVAVFVAAAALLWANRLAADGVKLDGGGSLSGSVLSSAKSVSVRTSSGALVVFDRAAVKQVVHGRGPAAKSGGSKMANANAQPKRRKLSAEEEAWMPKVHTLVSRRFGGDHERARQAYNQLLAIDDPDAIPALSTYLANSHNEEAHHLYVVILHNMKGPKPVYYLVALSLYDPSQQIRSEARKAFHEDQLDSARILYIAALRSGPSKLKRIAAIGLGEIGDPHGDSVPYLINSLVSYGTIGTITEPAQYGLLYTITVTATPGLNISNSTYSNGAYYTGQQLSGVYLTQSGQAEAQAALKKVTGPDQSLGISGTVSPPTEFGGQVAQDFAQNSPGTPKLQLNEVPMGGKATYTDTTQNATVVNDYQIPIFGEISGAHDKKLKGLADHPEVLEALLKVTDQKYPGFGFDQNRWRRWWANEKANRKLQAPASDRVIPSGGASH